MNLLLKLPCPGDGGVCVKASRRVRLHSIFCSIHCLDQEDQAKQLIHCVPDAFRPDMKDIAIAMYLQIIRNNGSDYLAWNVTKSAKAGVASGTKPLSLNQLTL